jgi:transposase
MRTITLTDAQWQNMLPFVRAGPHIDIGQEGRCRRFLSALPWMARSGAQWRLLPQESGDWTTVSKRFARWRKQGVFEPLPQFCANAPELEHLLLDSTVIRAHPGAAGARKKVGDKPARR